MNDEKNIIYLLMTTENIAISEPNFLNKIFRQFFLIKLTINDMINRKHVNQLNLDSIQIDRSF